MNSSFPVVRFGDVCFFDKRQGVHLGLPYVGLEHIESGSGRFIGSNELVAVKSPTFLFSSNHVLYGRLRPYLNKVMLPDFDGHCSTEIFPIHHSPSLDRKFLFYWLSMDSTVNALNETSTGARMPRANMNALLEFDVPIPDLSVQRRIVKILDSAFEGIETVKANAEEGLRKASEFFDAALRDVFGAEMVFWPKQRLDAICSLVTDGTHNSPPYVDSGVPMLDSKHIGGRFDIDDSGADKFITYEMDALLSRRCKPRSGDVLVSSRGTIGKIAIVKNGQDFNIMGNMILLRFLPFMDNNFMAFYMLSRVASIEAMAKGVAQKGLYLGQVRGYEVPVPPVEQQRQISGRLRELQVESANLSKIIDRKISSLNELRKALLQRAFAGQL